MLEEHCQMTNASITIFKSELFNTLRARVRYVRTFKLA